MRSRLTVWMTWAFVVLLVAMFVIAGCLVALQVVGLVSSNASLVTGAAAQLKPWLFRVSAIFGVWTLLLAYVAGWKPAE